MLPISRWVLLLFLLAIEVLAFTLRFDTQSLVRVDGVWASLAGNSSLVCQLVLTTAVVALVFGGDRLKSVGERLSLHFRALPNPQLPLFLHFVLLAVFYRLSVLAFDDAAFVTSYSYWAVGLWFATGLLTIGCLLAGGIPPTLWWPVTRSLGTLVAASGLLALAALAAGQLAHWFWQPLGSGTLWLVGQLLRLFYNDVVVQPGVFEVGTSTFAVEIAPACSGYEGIGLILVFMTAFLGWYRRELKFPNVLLLVPIGVAAIWLANSLRIAALVAIGTNVSPTIALGGFHSQAGWLAFNAIALGLVAVAWQYPWFSRSATSAESTRRSYPAAPYLIPFLTLVAAGMIASAFTSADALDRLYPLKIGAVLMALACFAQLYRRQQLLAGGVSWSAVALGVAVFILWIALEPLAGVAAQTSAGQGAALASMPSLAAAAWIGFRVVGSVIVVPLVEELAFRGFLSRRLIAEDFASIPLGRFTWTSFVISSVVFGILHQRWLAASLAGALFALALHRRGRLIDAVVAHATANGLVTAYVLATGRWAAWS